MGCDGTMAYTCAFRVHKNKRVINVSMEVSIAYVCNKVLKEVFLLLLVCSLLFDYPVICFMPAGLMSWKILILQTTFPPSFSLSLVSLNEYLKL